MKENRKVAAIVLAAGKGTRMKSDLPKVMMPLCGKPMIRHIINTLEAMHVDKIIPVISPDGALIAKEVAPYETALQEKQLGTGHAAICARSKLCGFEGDILVMFGDHPVITKETLKKALRKKQEGYSVVVLGFHPQDALRYGRLIMNGDELVKIVEYKDASDEEKAINFCNSGVMVFDSETMFDILSSISNENAAGEYYLTDAIAIARRRGLKCGAIECNPDELSGANTQEELAALEKYLTARNAKKGN